MRIRLLLTNSYSYITDSTSLYKFSCLLSRVSGVSDKTVLELDDFSYFIVRSRISSHNSQKFYILPVLDGLQSQFSALQVKPQSKYFQ